MSSAGWPVLTPRQVLENRIRADYRNVRDIDIMVLAPVTLTAFIADAVVRWRDARAFGDRELLRGAEHNLDLLAEVWQMRGGGR